MRVMHVVAPAPVGGLEQVLVALAGGQQAAGHSVSVAAVVAAGEQEPAVVARLKSLGIDVHVIASQPRAYWSQVSAIRSLHERLAPDTIHTHGYHPRRPRRCSQAIHLSCNPGFYGSWIQPGPLKNRVYERLQLHALRRFDAVVAVSRKLAAELKAGGCQPSRVRVLPNAWSPIDPPLAKTDARQALGIPGEIFSVGWVGRVSYEKGLDVLVRALSLVTEIPLRLTVIGDGPERPVAQNLAQTLGVDAHIAWPGRVPDAARLLRAFDVLVISSRTEGTPMTLLEAMSAGVPILTTAVGGIPDVVSQDDAILVSPEDPAAIADGLRALYADPEAAAVRAERARARVESAYAVQPWVEAYDLVYSAARTVADAK
jgi:glycosyltransferase involved in cell wall biosynthesis